MLKPNHPSLARSCYVRALAFLAAIFSSLAPAYGAGDVCSVCGKEIRESVYSKLDRVTHKKRFVCADCLKLSETCFLCGFPVAANFTRLPDGRVLCARDVELVALDDRESLRTCEQVKDDFDRQFYRFLAIPSSNITVKMMDRVNLQALFRGASDDNGCPNTLGYTQPVTNDAAVAFEISLLSAQPKEDLKTTCVHEYTHAWIFSNVAPGRRKILSRDAIEGFCELLSFLFAEQQSLSLAKSNILANPYTRGQIQLFIAATAQYGLNDILDWMKYGEDRRLQREDLSRVRRLQPKPILAKAPPLTTNSLRSANPPPKLPAFLKLQGVVWSKTQPMATINGKNFEPNQVSVVQLLDGPVSVRCLEISPSAVVLQTNDGPDKIVLQLK